MRAFALATLAKIALVLAFSNLDRGLWIITGAAAELMAAAYAAAAVALVVRPANLKANLAAMITGCLFWLDRGGSFIELVQNGRPDLIGTVGERGWAAVATVAVHLLSIVITEQARAVERLEDVTSGATGR